MTIRLTPEQSYIWDEGGWLSLRIQDDIFEQVQQEGITETVVVELDTGEVLFAISQGGLA